VNFRKHQGMHLENVHYCKRMDRYRRKEGNIMKEKSQEEKKEILEVRRDKKKND
jgi:hypothetical protein